MKRTKKISNLKQTAILLLGILIAIVLCVSQTGYFNTKITKANVEHNSDSDSDTEEISTVLSVDAITSTVQLHVAHVFYFISENIVSQHNLSVNDIFEKPQLETYLSVIFRQIISPNAP